MQAMTKKTISLALFVVSIFCITACSSKVEENLREPMIEEVTNLPDAEIKIPSTLIGNELEDVPILDKNAHNEQNNLTTSPAEETHSDTEAGSQEQEDSTSETASPEIIGQLDEDNNVTYQLDGNTRTQLINNMAAEIENSIGVILADKEYYPNVADITVNSDCTEFTIYLTVDSPNLYESTLMMSFYTLGDRYQIYKGASLENVKTTVVYINQQTGMELARTDSTSMRNSE